MAVLVGIAQRDGEGWRLIAVCNTHQDAIAIATTLNRHWHEDNMGTNEFTLVNGVLSDNIELWEA